MHNFTEKLFLIKEQNDNFAAFTRKIACDTKSEVIGVKIPKIRKLAKSLPYDKDLYSSFFNEEHRYLEEKLLHGFLIAKFKKDQEIYCLLEDFLPLADSWIITDTVAPTLKKLSKNKPELLNHVKKWLTSSEVYTVRFAIVILLDYFLSDEDLSETLELTLSVKSENYYINMVIAWLYSVILVKNYDVMINVLKNKTLPSFIQNKTISKATDSLRISKEKKEYLKTLKI